jgi:hypothetical protein
VTVTTKRRLSRFETAQTITSEYAPYNAVGIVRLVQAPSPQNLRLALDCLRKRHPLLQVRILKESGKYAFVRDSSLPLPFSVLPRPDDEYWQKVTEEELNCGFDASAGPLFRCRYLFPSEADSTAECILTVHHSIVDAESVVRMFDELLSLSADRQRGALSSEPTPLLLPDSAERFYPSAYKGFSSRWRTLVYLGRQLRDEISYRKGIRGMRRQPIFSSARCLILPYCLSADETDRLVRACRGKRVSINSALGAAMLLSVSRLVYGGQEMPLRHFIFANLRPYLKPPQGRERLGSYHSMMRLTIRLKKGQDYWELTERLNRLIYRAAKRGEKFISPLLSPMLMRLFIRRKNMRMGTTALSYPGVTGLKPQYGNTRLAAVHGFVSNFAIGPEYAATARIFDRRLWLDILYLDKDFDRPQAMAIAEEMLSVLRAASHILSSTEDPCL